MRDPKERLQDILEAIAAIERYADRHRAAFERDELLQSWLVRHRHTIRGDSSPQTAGGSRPPCVMN